MSNIKCRLCDGEFNIKQLGMHISRTHTTPYEEYAKKYWEDLPNWSPPCKNCGEFICKDTYCSDECYKSAVSAKFKGKKKPPRTKEHSENISKAKKKYFKENKHPWVGRKHSEKSLEKLSKTLKDRYKDKTNHGRYGKTLNDDSKQKLSNSMKDISKGKWNCIPNNKPYAF